MPVEQLLLYMHKRLDTPNGEHWVRITRNAVF